MDDEDRVSQFHEAVRQGCEEAVLECLENGIDVNSTVAFRSPLGIAAESGRNNIACLLIERGCNVNSLDRYMKSPLFVAIRAQNHELVNLLIKAGANLKHKRFNGYTPLHEAVYAADDNIVAELIKAGADVHAVDNARETPLHLACLFGCTDIVQILLEAGADINATKGPKGACPIHLAAFRGSPEIVEKLLQAGADVDTINGENKRAPIHHACIKNNLEALEILLCHGCNVNALSMENEEAKTSLIKAIECGHIDIINRLIEAGADVDLGDHYGVPPLITTVFKSNARIACMLIKAGCDVNKQCRNKLTSFTAAITRGQYNIAKMLLLAGYSITDVDLLQLQKLPVTDTMSPEDLEQLLFLINEVPSLKRLCRQSIRGHLGRRPGTKLKSLPLPQSLRKYLDFGDLEYLIPYNGVPFLPPESALRPIE